MYKLEDIINKIHCADCLDFMKEMPDNSVDFVITSPPYNVGNSVRGNLYGEYKDNLDINEYEKWICNVLDELLRVTDKYIFFNFQFLSGNKTAFLNIMSKYSHNIKEVIIWNKKQVAPGICPTVLSSKFEMVLVLSKKYADKRSFEFAKFNNREKGPLNNNVIEGDNASCSGDANYSENKAVFPRYFVQWFIDKFIQQGSLVLDPFSGTSTTAYVCKLNKINFIGIELDEKQVELSNERLRGIENNLFN